MTRGAAIFAINNGTTDYRAMAAWSAKRIRRHLDLPTTLITDSPCQDTAFDQVIVTSVGPAQSRWFDDIDALVPWHNQSRPTIYELSPYDETLLLDADYVVASDSLSSAFDVPLDLACYRWAYDVTGTSDYSDLNWFGRLHMPMSWATVIMFRRSQYAEMVFQMMQMIRTNWQHYRDLYACGRSVYRNDYAVSIALSTVNGHAPNYPGLPGRLANVDPKHRIQQLDEDVFRIQWITQDKNLRHMTLNGTDVHAMCKKQLGDIVAHSKI